MRLLELFLKIVFVILAVAVFLDHVLYSPYLKVFIITSLLLGIVLLFNKDASYRFKQTKRDLFIRRIEGIVHEQCKLAGLGDKATSNLMDWIETEYVEIAEFLPFQYNVEEKTPNSTGETVCITGKLKSFKTKAEAYEHLINAGFTVVESVTKTLNYLVDEEDKSSSKRQKAESYGITIITNLLDFIQGKKHD